MENKTIFFGCSTDLGSPFGDEQISAEDYSLLVCGEQIWAQDYCLWVCGRHRLMSLGVWWAQIWAQDYSLWVVTRSEHKTIVFGW